MFRKAAIAIIALSAMTGLLTGCAPFAYTGTGIVKEHRVSGKRCFATLETRDHGTAEFNIGPRSTCSSIVNESTIKLENGFYVK